jgi:hypothetical protein
VSDSEEDPPEKAQLPKKPRERCSHENPAKLLRGNCPQCKVGTVHTDPDRSSCDHAQGRGTDSNTCGPFLGDESLGCGRTGFCSHECFVHHMCVCDVHVPNVIHEMVHRTPYICVFFLVLPFHVTASCYVRLFLLFIFLVYPPRRSTVFPTSRWKMPLNGSIMSS